MSQPSPKHISEVVAAPLTKRQQQTAATADQLPVAARKVFESRGFVGTSIGAITAEANIAHGTLYLHFRNKQDVFARLTSEITDEMYQEARVPQTSDP